MKKFYKNDQAGRSMVEMLGVLAIIGVLSVGGIAGYSKAMGKFKITKMNDQIAMLVSNIRTAYGNQSSYAGLTQATAISLDLVPSDMVSGANLTNAFGTASIATAANNRSFTITFTELPMDACISVLTSDWGSESTGLVSISSNNAARVTPMSPTAAAAAGVCNAAGNTIAWTYN